MLARESPALFMSAPIRLSRSCALRVCCAVAPLWCAVAPLWCGAAPLCCGVATLFRAVAPLFVVVPPTERDVRAHQEATVPAGTGMQRAPVGGHTLPHPHQPQPTGVGAHRPPPSSRTVVGDLQFHRVR